MSFGVSITDIISLSQLTSQTYNGWKNACGDYADVTGDLASLNTIITRVESEAQNPASLLTANAGDLEGWKTLSKDCTSVVTDLSNVLKKYKSLGTSRSRNWDRIRIRTMNIESLRQRLVAKTAALSAFLAVLGISSVARIENKIFPELVNRIDELAAQVRAGRASVRSSLTTYEDDEKEVWREFRRDLIRSNIRSRVIARYSVALKAYIRHLQRDGQLDEEAPPMVDQPRSVCKHHPQCRLLNLTQLHIEYHGSVNFEFGRRLLS